MCWAEAIQCSSAEISSLVFSVPLSTARLFLLAWQLWTKRSIHAVTCLSQLKDDICCRMGRSIEMDTIDTSGSISFSRSGTGLSTNSGVDGHSL